MCHFTGFYFDEVLESFSMFLGGLWGVCKQRTEMTRLALAVPLSPQSYRLLPPASGSKVLKFAESFWKLGISVRLSNNRNIAHF